MDLTPLRKLLEDSRAALLRQAGEVPPELWKRRPGGAGWSAGEVVAHLIMVERKVTESAGKLLQEPPRRFSFWRRMGAPLFFVEHRIMRARTPIPLDPALVSEKKEMLARLEEARHATLALLEETAGRDLSAYGWPHPVRALGVLNFYEWFKLVARHEKRHTKQIQEIVESFQK